MLYSLWNLARLVGALGSVWHDAMGFVERGALTH
jgi:hypothetical protein